MEEKINHDRMERERKERETKSKGDDKSGKLVVEFYSHDDLDRIMDIIRK